jgi:hypothetical protein
MAAQNLVLKRVGVFSCAKVSGTLYAAFGLIAGLVLSFFAMIGAAIGVASEGGPEALLGLLFGVGAVVSLPILYGVLGLIGGAIAGLLYNLVAAVIGGIEVELE